MSKKIKKIVFCIALVIVVFVALAIVIHNKSDKEISQATARRIGVHYFRKLCGDEYVKERTPKVYENENEYHIFMNEKNQLEDTAYINDAYIVIDKKGNYIRNSWEEK